MSQPDQAADQLSERNDDDALVRLCARNLLASSTERVYFKDLHSRFLLVSLGWLNAEAHGRSIEEVLGKTDHDFFDAQHAADTLEDERQIIATGEPIVAKIECETYLDGPDCWVSTTKMPLRDESGVIVGTFGISRDITAQIAAEQALAHLAMHDHLTGLVNRVAMFDRLDQAISSLDRRPARMAVLFVDLDDFKQINDSYGHHTGDEVIREVARRLSSLMRRGDTVARLGGDEFVALCTVLGGDDDVCLIAERIVRTLSAPIVVAGHELVVTCSVGVAVTSDPAAEADALVRDADSAMYAAKNAGGRRYRVHDPTAHDPNSSRARDLAGELQCAIERSELFLLYQPLYTLDDQSLRGVEALVRWQHPTHGVLLPEVFVPFAEERGLIGRIDDLVLDEACRQLAAWNRSDSWPAGFTMSVNVSGHQLCDPDLHERVRATIALHGIDPALLCLEVTETALVGDVGDVEPALERLAGLGVRLALDDFGTGYSTLTHLRHFKVDFLKIDRSFVERLGENPRDKEIIAAVTAMSHALGISVVGEGIETRRQLEHLSALNCDTGQGFLFAHPLEADAVAALVTESWRRETG